MAYAAHSKKKKIKRLLCAGSMRTEMETTTTKHENYAETKNSTVPELTTVIEFMVLRGREGNASRFLQKKMEK